MNNQPITQANDPDLRHSHAALQRAASRAREVALRTGTRIVVVQEGRIRFLNPLEAGITESSDRYGESE